MTTPSLPWYIDRDGNEIDVHEWARLKCDWTYRVIGDDTVHGLRILTLWHGENFLIAHGRAPIIFGTAIDRDTATDEKTEATMITKWEHVVSYRTLEQAAAGHRWFVKWFKENPEVASLRDVASGFRLIEEKKRK